MQRLFVVVLRVWETHWAVPLALVRLSLTYMENFCCAADGSLVLVKHIERNVKHVQRRPEPLDLGCLDQLN